MCQQVVQFCSSSTKPLLFGGGLLSLLLAVAIGYTACTTHALYADIDPQVAQSKSLAYNLQLAAAGYLALITLFSFYAAHSDQKHSIRALSVLASLNFILALVAILTIPTGKEVAHLFTDTLKQAIEKYDYTEKPAISAANSSLPTGSVPQQLERQDGAGPVALNSSTSRPVRWAQQQQQEGTEQAGNNVINKLPARDLNKTEATRMWDRLQARGCCGMTNATVDWHGLLPKSCCDTQLVSMNDNPELIKCTKIDDKHSHGCLDVISATSFNLLVVLALVALVNLYLAVIAGFSAYRTLHYNEASQSAYT